MLWPPCPRAPYPFFLSSLAYETRKVFPDKSIPPNYINSQSPEVRILKILLERNNLFYAERMTGCRVKFCRRTQFFHKILAEYVRLRAFYGNARKSSSWYPSLY